MENVTFQEQCRSYPLASVFCVYFSFCVRIVPTLLDCAPEQGISVTDTAFLSLGMPDALAYIIKY